MQVDRAGLLGWVAVASLTGFASVGGAFARSVAGEVRGGPFGGEARGPTASGVSVGREAAVLDALRHAAKGLYRDVPAALPSRVFDEATHNLLRLDTVERLKARDAPRTIAEGFAHPDAVPLVADLITEFYRLEATGVLSGKPLTARRLHLVEMLSSTVFRSDVPEGWNVPFWQASVREFTNVQFRWDILPTGVYPVAFVDRVGGLWPLFREGPVTAEHLSLYRDAAKLPRLPRGTRGTLPLPEPDFAVAYFDSAEAALGALPPAIREVLETRVLPFLPMGLYWSDLPVVRRTQEQLLDAVVRGDEAAVARVIVDPTVHGELRSRLGAALHADILEAAEHVGRMLRPTTQTEATGVLKRWLDVADLPLLPGRTPAMRDEVLRELVDAVAAGDAPALEGGLARLHWVVSDVPNTLEQKLRAEFDRALGENPGAAP